MPLNDMGAGLRFCVVCRKGYISMKETNRADSDGKGGVTVYSYVSI
jgi:hypothetical protein